MVLFGIDVAKASLDRAILTPAGGKPLGRRSFPNSPEGVDRAARWVAEVSKSGAADTHLIVEATKHLQQSIESDHFRVKRAMPRVGGFRSFSTARRTIQGFEAMLWLRKDFGFASAWSVREQNRLLGVCFGLQAILASAAAKGTACDTPSQ